MIDDIEEYEEYRQLISKNIEYEFLTEKYSQNSAEKNSREEYLYHNTELLLKKYRDVVWSIIENILKVKYFIGYCIIHIYLKVLAKALMT